MIKIKDLLLKFSKILLSEEVKKQSVRKIISENIGIAINSEDIKIKDGIIYLKTNNYFKNEVFLKKELILGKINNKTDNKILDIR